MNGVSPSDFAVDMGFSIKRILNLEQGALQRLAQLGGLDEQDLEKLASWTGKTIGNVRIAFRGGEVFVSRMSGELYRGHPRFGRQVGLRRRNGFVALVKAGHTPATRMKHRVTGTAWFYVSDADVAAFHRQFLTSTTMAEEFEGHWRTLLAKLEAAGVSRFAPNGEDYGNVFLREDVEASLRPSP